jgi:hypothetical protein
MKRSISLGLHESCQRFGLPICQNFAPQERVSRL